MFDNREVSTQTLAKYVGAGCCVGIVLGLLVFVFSCGLATWLHSM